MISLEVIEYNFPFSSGFFYFLFFNKKLNHSSTIALFNNASTVSEGCAPTDNHFLIAGALRLASFFKGSYHPKYSKGAPSLRFLESIAMIL